MPRMFDIRTKGTPDFLNLSAVISNAPLTALPASFAKYVHPHFSIKRQYLANLPVKYSASIRKSDVLSPTSFRLTSLISSPFNNSP